MANAYFYSSLRGTILLDDPNVTSQAPLNIEYDIRHVPIFESLLPFSGVMAVLESICQPFGDEGVSSPLFCSLGMDRRHQSHQIGLIYSMGKHGRATERPYIT